MVTRTRWLLAACALLVAASAAGVRAESAQDPVVEISGPITALAIEQEADAAPGAVIVVNGNRVRIPPDVSVELPATRASVADLFRDAPAACRPRGESGLAQVDVCRTVPDATGNPALATVLSPARATLDIAETADGQLVASRVRITRSGEPLYGGVTFINVEGGYIRVNGHYRQDEGGTLIRINDPLGQQSAQSGPGCGSEGNCSPDRRFRIDSNEISVRFERGNPACIGDASVACPRENRLVAADDIYTRVPILVGDNVTAQGSFEIVAGARVFLAQALLVQAVLPADR
jgi:hypothetical protein